ncbi:MAG: Glu/Leu/Phe/Val dehydrogenase dimerization domain-containing protein [Candidatus Kariarchaeaceae archaeon]|jgi:glutamate dehydrogenase/leucine dehydrogenase
MTQDLLITTDNPIGFVSIDDTRFPLAVGGIRMISGVSANEVKLLSRSMSFKLHSFGFPMSGGKGGVDSDDPTDFFKYIANPQVKNIINGTSSLQFITGPDIGTSEDLYYDALRSAGLEKHIRKGLLSGISSRYGLPLDNLITAYGVVVACEELLSIEVPRGTDPLLGKSFSIEGFGKVGTGLVKLLENRTKIVAISTRYGTITDPDGLDISRLLDLQSQFGDNCVYEYGAEVHPTDHLFTVTADILVPGARTEVIDSNIAQKIINVGTRHIVPVSNYPYTSEGLEILSDTHITVFPDFIASAGAVIAAMIEFANVGGESEAFDLVHAAISYETKDLLMAIKACGDGSMTMYELALQRANARREELVTENTSSISDIANKVISTYLPHLLH